MEKIKEVLTWLQFQELLSYGFWDLLVNVILFGLAAVPAFVFFWIIFKDKLRSRRIQPKRNPASAPHRQEIKNSLVSLVILTVVDILIYLAQLKGHTQLYTDVSEYGWLYLGFSIILLIILHDTIYYFLHRIMHMPGVYQLVHKVHHQSTDPSPFAAFSFHPLEALVESLPYVFFAFAFPVHMAALWCWQIVQVTMNIISHLGYEMYPKGFTKHWLFKFKTPSTHHNMHHERCHGNFGLYFTWLDKLFKTEFTNYHETYEAIQQRIEKDKEANTHTATIGDPALHKG